mgnify:CR=1 FL=1
MWKYYFFVVFCLWHLIPSGYASAQSGNIVVSPAFEEVVLNQGETEKVVTVTLQNDSLESYVAHLEVFDFGSLDESGGVAFLGGEKELEKKYSLASWVRPETDVLILAPGESKEVKVTIENRDSLSPGGHYGALIFRLEKGEGYASEGNSVAVERVFSSLFFVKKVGGEIYQMKLHEKDLKTSFFSLPRTARLRFENTGNVHLIPRGLITVEDPLKRKVAKGTINPESSILLPESFRIFNTALKPLRTAFLPGIYTATFEYRFENTESTEKESIRFFLTPLPFVVILVSILGIFGLYVGYRLRRRSH